MVQKAKERKVEQKEHLRDGKGSVTLSHLFAPDDTFGKCKMCAVIAIEPGCSIGPHAHGPDAELYYVLEGRVTVAEKGEELVLEPGDAMMVGGGESHFAENRGVETVRLLAVVMN